MDAGQLFQVTHVAGIAAWSTLAGVNNIVAYRSSVAAVGRTMSMEPLDQRPVVDIAIKSRAVRSSPLHHIALVAVLCLQLLGAALLWMALWGTFTGVLGWQDTAAAGLTSLAVCWLAMLTGGLWFGYWIRQEGLQLTHLALLAWTCLVYLVLRSPW